MLEQSARPVRGTRWRGCLYGARCAVPPLLLDRPRQVRRSGPRLPRHATGGHDKAFVLPRAARNVDLARACASSIGKARNATDERSGDEVPDVRAGHGSMRAQTEPGPGENARRRAFRGWTTSRRAASGSPATSSLHHAGPDPSAFETARRSSPMVRHRDEGGSRRVRHHRVRQPRGSRRDRCGASHRPVRDDRGAAGSGSELVAHDGVPRRLRSRRSGPSPGAAARPGARGEVRPRRA